MSESDFYVLLLKATAQAGCSRPPGAEHQIITIVSAPTYEEAREVTLIKLAENFWSSIKIERYGQLQADMANSAYLKAAVADAHERGFGLVVYETKKLAIQR